jgi:cardiolipin synthase
MPDASQRGGWVAEAVPSVITAIRLVLLPVVVVLVRSGGHPVLIFLLLGVMGVTDFLDGYVARRIGGVTTFGKVFDPTSDRIVVIVMGIAFTMYHVIPLSLAIPLLVREALVSIIVIVLLVVYHRRVDVVWIGKAGTFGLLLALPLLIFHQSSGTLAHNVYLGGLVIAALGTLGLYLAGYDYIRVLLDASRASKRGVEDTKGSTT